MRTMVGMAAAGLAGLIGLAATGCESDGGGPGGSGSGNGAGGGGGGGTSGYDFEALDHVRGDEFPRLLVEIDHVEGFAPGADALADVQGEVAKLVLGGHLGKPGGVEFVIDEALPAHEDPEHVYTFDELDALGAAHRSLEPAADQSYLHVLYADALYEKEGVLGFAWGGDRLVVLKGYLDDTCKAGTLGPILSKIQAKVCQITEAQVLLHELGHLFGLVANGVEMAEPHEDAEHARHDVNEDCVMYWAVESSSVVDLVAQKVAGGDEEVSAFDAACLADLLAAQD